MRSTKPCLIALALIALVPAAASAKKNDPNIQLAYTPTTGVAEASAVPTSDMRDVDVALRVEDDRAGDDARVIGNRTDDDDRRVDLVATNDVEEFVQSALVRQAREWSFPIVDQDDADLVLAVKLTQLRIEETNQAVGATYEAWCTFEFELRERSGKEKWSGLFKGDATRYGKKYSEGNTNEVISDAIAEALAYGLSDSGLRKAWGR